VFFIVTFLHWLIPDTPKVIRDQIERENYITQRALWEYKPVQLANVGLSSIIRTETMLRRLANQSELGNDDDENRMSRENLSKLFTRKLSLSKLNALDDDDDDDDDDNYDIVTNI
jgi:hypothetical protein